MERAQVRWEGLLTEDGVEGGRPRRLAELRWSFDSGEELTGFGRTPREHTHPDNILDPREILREHQLRPASGGHGEIRWRQ